MYYRFHVFAVAFFLLATAGMAQAQDDYTWGWQRGQSPKGPSALMAQNPTMAPVPDDAADAGPVIEQDVADPNVADPNVVDGPVPAPVVMDQGHPECCDCRYCTAYSCDPGFAGLACGSAMSNFFFGDEQGYGGYCSPYMYSKRQFVMESWIDQGFTWNTANPSNKSNDPLGFNDRANQYEMNQLYLAMERKIDHGKLWDWGARLDLLYGTDYFYTQAIGLETRSNGARRWNEPGPRDTAIPGDGGASLYGLAMPQLYAEFLTPIAYGTTIKIGHFYSIMGHESVMAPENFFYSHSYSMLYAEPFTHTGILFDYHYEPNFSVKAGIVRGWDAWDEPYFRTGAVDRVGFLGGVSWQSCDKRTALDFNLYTGNEQLGAVDGKLQNRTNYSLVFKRDITPRLTYVFQHDLGVQQGGASRVVGPGETEQINTHWYTIVNYLYYKMNERTSIGCRLEWFSDPELNRVFQLGSLATGGDYYEATFGINWKPFDRCVVRPELRWDWSNTTTLNGGGAYNDFSDKNQFTLGIDALYTF